MSANEQAMMLVQSLLVDGDGFIPVIFGAGIAGHTTTQSIKDAIKDGTVVADENGNVLYSSVVQWANTKQSKNFTHATGQLGKVRIPRDTPAETLLAIEEGISQLLAEIFQDEWRPVTVGKHNTPGVAGTEDEMLRYVPSLVRELGADDEDEDEDES